MPKLTLAIDNKNYLDTLKELKGFPIVVKIGPIVFLEEGFSLLKALKQDGFEVFLDLKFHDIPNTVLKTVEVCAKHDVDYLTIHLLGGENMLSSLKDIKGNTNIIGVTILTSHDESYMKFLHSNYSLEDMVLHLASVAYKYNLDGVVCSSFEAFSIKSKFPNLKTVIPGIRLNKDEKDDQKRVATIEEVLEVADLIVMGRAIFKSEDPKQTTLDILSKIGGFYGNC
ncbi:orotidine-5'-phosphate decarboxylase [Hydrogenobaculum acidophilum]